MTRAVDAALRAAVDRGDVPHALMIAADRDHVLHAGVAGARAAGGGEPLALDAVLRIASMTKPVTTVAALQLVERGRLDLDAPVRAYRPEFAELRVLDGFVDGAPVLRAPRTDATVRQLATHTSGLSYWFWNADLATFERLTGTPNILTGAAAALRAPLVADPGTRFEYGISTDWLGLVVEAVSGLALDAYVAQEITGPLGMAETTFHPHDDLRARLVPVHRRGPDGAWAPTGIDWPRSPDWWAGGHGLYSTARDFLAFQRALLRGGELDGVRILAEASVDAAFRDQLSGLRFPRHIATAHPASSADADFGPGSTWGFGLLLNAERAAGRRAVGSGGWAGIYNTHFWVDRRAGLTVAVYGQTLPFLDPGALRLVADVEAAVYRCWGR